MTDLELEQKLDEQKAELAGEQPGDPAPPRKVSREEKMARVAFEAVRALNVILKDDMAIAAWDDTSRVMREHMIQTVEVVAANPRLLAPQIHELWRQRMAQLGWTHGETRNIREKRDPRMAPFHEIDGEHKVRQSLIVACVRELQNFLP